jgi:hypothetical protein
MSDDERAITVTIGGRFTPFELAALVNFIRGLDRDQRHWSFTIHDKDGATLREAEELLRRIVPEVPGRETTFEVHRKQ